MIDYIRSGICSDIHQEYLESPEQDAESIPMMGFRGGRSIRSNRFNTCVTIGFRNHIFGTESIQKKKRMTYNLDYRSKHLNWNDRDINDIFKRLKYLMRNKYEY